MLELGVYGTSIPKYLNLSTLSQRVRLGGILSFFVFPWFIGIPIRDAPVMIVCSIVVRWVWSINGGGIRIVPSSAKKRRCVKGRCFFI